MTAPTYFELTNNGDLYNESVNTKEKLLPQREKYTNGSKFRYDNPLKSGI
jgi:hypothetical protein